MFCLFFPPFVAWYFNWGFHVARPSSEHASCRQMLLANSGCIQCQAGSGLSFPYKTQLKTVGSFACADLSPSRHQSTNENIMIYMNQVPSFAIVSPGFSLMFMFFSPHFAPGRREDWSSFLASAQGAHLHAVLCLTDSEERRQKSPKYAEVVEKGEMPCEVWHGACWFPCFSFRFQIWVVVCFFNCLMLVGQFFGYMGWFQPTLLQGHLDSLLF